ncbi:MAG: head-tail adaptor protein [Paracoccus sp. (in: a-proteobacteria)]|nr:head-tail adaptor protein [Paracoccus sp. (in: a-proteobacteria)]
MAVPQFNTRLALETPDRVADGMGGYLMVWRQLGLLWGAMDAGAAREQGSISTVRWRITLRAAPQGDEKRPRAGQRFRLEQRLFLIEAVAESDTHGRFLICHAREEDPT